MFGPVVHPWQRPVKIRSCIGWGMLCCRYVFVALVACLNKVVVGLIGGIGGSVWLFRVVVDKMGTAQHVGHISKYHILTPINCGV